MITKSISRLARNTVTLLQTVRELKSLGVDVYFEEQNIHTMSSEGELMMTILASYAQEESRSASENQKWRIKKNFEEGMAMIIRESLPRLNEQTLRGMIRDIEDQLELKSDNCYHSTLKQLKADITSYLSDNWI